MSAAAEEMIENGAGRMVPRRQVRPEVLQEDDLVRDLVEKAETLHDAIVAFKNTAINDIEAHAALVAERYGVKLGGRRGGLRLHSFDQRLRVEVSVADTMTFGAELQAAKVLIDECLTEWTEGGNDNIRTVVMEAFEVGEGKKLRVDRILGLRRLNIDDAKWQRAMEAIADALRVERSKQYIRLYRRANADAPFRQIALDASRV